MSGAATRSASRRRRFASGEQQPDLQARVYVGEAFLAASDVRYNASDGRP